MTRLNHRMPGLLNDTASCAAIDTLPIGAVRAPVLVIHGTGDRVVPFAHAERIGQLLAEAHLLAIPEGEHVALFTHLGDVRAATARLLASRR
jgi:pimeloyl-ACP methyl ester carboxylesterase